MVSAVSAGTESEPEKWNLKLGQRSFDAVLSMFVCLPSDLTSRAGSEFPDHSGDCENTRPPFVLQEW